MNQRVLMLLLFLIAPFSGASSHAADFDYAQYAALLAASVKQGVTIDGVKLNTVDYGRLKRDADDPDSAYRKLLSQLAGFDPAALATREERIAFWINVYNIAAIKTILDHYPVDSIRSRKVHWLKLPWNRKVITVGGREYALAEIEFDILLETYRDLRIHFGINCASVSCVDLLPEPYRAERLSAQLEAQGRRFMADQQRGMRIDRSDKTIYLSQIFKFDKKHFDSLNGGALSFIGPFIGSRDRDDLRTGGFAVEYLDYNWKTNDAANAK